MTISWPADINISKIVLFQSSVKISLGAVLCEQCDALQDMFCKHVQSCMQQLTNKKSLLLQDLMFETSHRILHQASVALKFHKLFGDYFFLLCCIEYGYKGCGAEYPYYMAV